MLKEYRTQVIIGIWGGFLFFLVGLLVASMPQAVYHAFGSLVMLGGYVLFVSGCFMYALGKGQSPYWGILGILGPAGLLVLYCLKDRSNIILVRRRREDSN